MFLDETLFIVEQPLKWQNDFIKLKIITLENSELLRGNKRKKTSFLLFRE